MNTKVYKYSLRMPAENGQLVYEQMRLAHRYRNTLVEIERGRRAAYRALTSEHAGIGTLEDEVRRLAMVERDAHAAIKLHRAAHRSRTAPVELTDAHQAAKDVVKAARASLRDARAAFRADQAMQRRVNCKAKPRCGECIQCRAAQLKRNARHHSGCYWGTYLIVEQAHEASCDSTPIYADPRFLRWRGDGRIGVQLQGGLSISKVLGGHDTRLQIDMPALAQLGSPTRSVRRRAARQAVLRMRVGSDATGKPIWASWPMVMHRPVPDGARVKWGMVNLRMKAYREIWTVDLVVEVPAPSPRIGNRTAALNLGWRQLPNGTLRVATAVGTDGLIHHVALDAERFSQESRKGRVGARLPPSLTYHHTLQSIRDQNFLAARDALAEWLGRSGLETPFWLRERVKCLAQWRSIPRLASLLQHWSDNRFLGDEPAFESLDAWHKNDRHLWMWRVAQEKKSRRARREVYRRAAAQLATRYDTLLICDMDLRDFAMRDGATEDQPRRQRFLAAGGELTGALKNAFLSRGGSVVVLPAPNTTKTCSKCAHLNDFDAAKNLEHTCDNCGARWDQDQNHCRVLLGFWRERPGDAVKVLGARSLKDNKSSAVSESRFAKRRSKAAGSLNKRRSARKTSNNAAE